MKLVNLLFSVCLVGVLVGVSITCWELAYSRLEQRLAQRYVPRNEVEAVVIQANQVITAHDAALKELQAKISAPKGE